MMTILEFCTQLKQKHPSAECFFVGGCVRDSILKIKPKDYDVVIRNVPINDLEAALKDFGIKHDLVGKSFGVIKAKFKEGIVDIALPRREVSTGDGHRDFLVQSDPTISLKEDASRRDFTMNAIYADVLTAGIEDPLNGINDLDLSTLVATSNKTFEDDPLRILRAIQFCARFDLTINDRDTDLIKKSLPKLNTVSPERVALELNKLLKADRPSIGLSLALKLGIINEIIPELAFLSTIDQTGKWHNANAFVHTIRVVDHVRPETNMRFAALFHDLGKATTREVKNNNTTFHGHEKESVKIAKTIIDRLKLSTIEGFNNELVTTLIANHMYDRRNTSTYAIRRLVRKVGGIDTFHLLSQLKAADVLGGGHPNKVGNQLEYLRLVCKVMSKTKVLDTKDLVINGNDIMQEFDLKPGPLVGKILNIMFSGVERDLVENDYDKLISWFTNLILEG